MRETSTSVQSLLRDLDCDEIMKCQKARRALVVVGSEAVRPLTEALSSSKRWVRWEAAKALGQIGDAAATAALVKALEDEEFDVRWLSAEALVSIGTPAVVPLLQTFLAHPDFPWLREGAHHVLHDMKKGRLDRILRPVIQSIDDGEPVESTAVAIQQALDALKRGQ